MSNYVNKVRLQDICEIRAGVPAGRARGNAKGNSDSSVLILSQKAVTRTGIVHEELERISGLKIKEELLTRKGDVIVKVSPPYNSVYINEFDAGILVTSSFVIVRKNKKTPVDMQYLAFFLNSNHMKAILKDITVGTSLPLLKRSTLLALEIPLPSIGKQKQLAFLARKIEKINNQCRQMIYLGETLLESKIDKAIFESGSVKVIDFQYAHVRRLAVEEEEQVIQRGMNKVWAEFKKDSTPENYEQIVVAYLKTISTYLDAEYRAMPSAKEIQVGRWLGEFSQSTVKFKFASDIPGSINPDIRWEGEDWEIKRVESVYVRKVFANAKRASRQSHNIILDLSLHQISIADAQSKTNAIFEELPVNKLIFLAEEEIEMEKR